MSTTVVNMRGHRDDPDWLKGVVYVGRGMFMGGWRLAGHPLANPFPVRGVGDREEAISKYRAHILGRPDLLELIPGLRGARLGCWCSPLHLPRGRAR